jgi:hypothetical protein
MGMQPFGPDPGGARGGPEQEILRQEAEHERLVKQTEEIHSEEASELASESESTPASKPAEPAKKTPWWKFWSS